jgi:cytochrome c2
MLVKMSIATIITILIIAACGGGSEESKGDGAKTESNETIAKYGIGPITKVDLGPINQALVENGKQIFETKCLACHKLDQKYVAPRLGDVTRRRTPEFIMNQILNPAENIQKNPEIKKYLGEFPTPMTFQNVTKNDARAILEYLRDYAEKNEK